VVKHILRETKIVENQSEFTSRSTT